MFGKKEAVLVLIVLLSLVLFNINKEDITGMQVAETSSSTLGSTCASEPTPEILWNLYSKIPEYSGDNEKIFQAALNGWDVWTRDNPDKNLLFDKEQIEEGLRKIFERGGCMDDFSLNARDDCWNQNALCIEGGCIAFENMGWSQEILENVRKLKTIDMSRGWDSENSIRSGAAELLGEEAFRRV